MHSAACIATPTLQCVATVTVGTGLHAIRVLHSSPTRRSSDLANNYNAASGAWTFTPATGFSDGTHNLTVVVQDAAGNFVNTNYSVTIDTVNPSEIGRAHV